MYAGSSVIAVELFAYLNAQVIEEVIRAVGLTGDIASLSMRAPEEIALYK